MTELFAGSGVMGAAVRCFDWSKTPLGPVERWPAGLHATVSLALGSTFPMAIIWGQGHVQVYNEGYRPICGPKHPGSMGQDFRECWASAFPVIGPSYDRAWAGEASFLEDQRLFVERKGFLEETCFTFSFSPIRDESGKVAGLFHPVTETTSRMLAERRTRTLRDLAARGTKARTVDEACELASQTLAGGNLDLPFVLIYRISGDGGALQLAGASGLRAGGAGAPALARLDSKPGEGWPFAEALASTAAITVDDLLRRFGEITCGPYPEPPHSALVLPITVPGVERPLGVLVAGVSPRLPLDDSYRDFYVLLAAAVGVTIGNAHAYEGERRRADALAEIDRAKTAFFSNISHEFRTPLTLMLGPLEDALAGPDRTLHGKSLEVTHRNAVRLLKLVNALLDFSRIEAGRVQAHYQPVDLATSTIELASVFRSAIERAGMTLVLQCEPLSAPVHVDPEMWEKIVLNLLSNAFKFTFAGEIEVTLRQVGGRAELRVRDTGTGVEAHELPRLFERFHRIDGAKSRSHEGSGIGLALVAELVRMHGGEIRAESQYGNGTTFTVSIPMGTAHLTANRIMPSEPGAQARTTAASVPFLEEALQWLPDWTGTPANALPPRPNAPETATSRILVVDDNADLREYLRRILGAEWIVETAPDGVSALEAARIAPPALVLADVMMPGLSGFGLLAALRQDPRTQSVPVVMLSARSGEEAKVEGLDAGADDYLTKPLSARELVARVRSQLALSTIRRERHQLLEREQAARKEAELQRQHLFSLFTQAPTPITILRGPEYVIELANPGACQLLGRTHEQLINRGFFDACPEFAGQGFRGLLDGVLTTGEPYVGKEVPNTIARGRSGVLETVYSNFVYSPMRNVQGDIGGVLVFAFDVTDLVLARNQMTELRWQAQSASRAKDEFLAMLGHELRNPLAPILTALQLMRMRGVDSREQDILERQVGHVTRLVDDLLDVARITQGKITLRKERGELADTVVKALEICSPMPEQRRQKVDVRVPTRGLGVSVDPDRMAQVLSNLITNASKYSEPGSQIVITATQEGGRVRISVQDEGVGIAPEMITRVFDSFAQQPQTLDRARGGLGLGLTIVRSLVELHGGTVSARSEGIGKGSEFVVELPAIDLVAPADVAAPAERSAVAQPVRPGGRRILVVDDNEDAVEVLRQALEALGYVVAAALDGPTALVAAASFRPDIALLDIGLPVMDGYELAKRLRALQDPTRVLRIVALTGYGQETDRQRSTDAGFDRHLVKPVSLSDIERVAEELLAAAATTSP